MLSNSQTPPPDGPGQNRIKVFVPHFGPEEWQRVLDHWEDPREKMTFEEQRSVQASMVETLRKDGTEVEEIPVDPGKLLSWIKKQNLKNDGQGRAGYYAEVGRCRGLGLPVPE